MRRARPWVCQHGGPGLQPEEGRHVERRVAWWARCRWSRRQTRIGAAGAHLAGGPRLVRRPAGLPPLPGRMVDKRQQLALIIWSSCRRTRVKITPCSRWLIYQESSYGNHTVWLWLGSWPLVQLCLGSRLAKCDRLKHVLHGDARGNGGTPSVWVYKSVLILILSL
jgi:hypothetical protein